jgi:hypothetical protein
MNEAQRPPGAAGAAGGFSLLCERVRSKPRQTLTHPENRPCGYAVHMLRTTSAPAQVRAYSMSY